MVTNKTILTKFTLAQRFCEEIL